MSDDPLSIMARESRKDNNMSTRASVKFDGDWGTPMIYKHSDGYPDGEHGMIALLDGFFEWNERLGEGVGDRYDDANYLAARFVAFLTRNGYDGLGVGVMMTEPNDIAYRYIVPCHATGYGKHPRPTVRVENPRAQPN